MAKTRRKAGKARAKRRPKRLMAEECFEAYWGMGPGRSLRGLAAELARKYRGSVKGRQSSVEKMSRRDNWQERVAQRIGDESKRVRRQLAERTIRIRERLADALGRDIERYIRKLNATKRSRKPIAVHNATACEKLTKLMFTLAEQPLADRAELSGPGGGPIEFDLGGMTDEELVDRVSDLVGKLGPDAARRAIQRIEQALGRS